MHRTDGSPPAADVLALRTLAVVLCMVTARSAAMAFNRLVDATIDARNPRTAGRHLPAGRLKSSGVWLFFAGMVLPSGAAVHCSCPTGFP